MLLIPILENAFKYSGLGINNYAFVNFKIYEVNNKLQVVCENSIAPNKISNEPGGIGLTNINKRLEMGYANQYKLDIAEANNVFILTLTIPMI
jgi:LytS/YehU family sensor histidine kinase